VSVLLSVLFEEVMAQQERQPEQQVGIDRGLLEKPIDRFPVASEAGRQLRDVALPVQNHVVYSLSDVNHAPLSVAGVLAARP